VPWSRLGGCDVAALDRALYQDGGLFEYWATMLPTSDLSGAIADLAGWLGAGEIVLGEIVLGERWPAIWTAALAAL
jgi:uncharacterized protein YcaQ